MATVHHASDLWNRAVVTKLGAIGAHLLWIFVGPVLLLYLLRHMLMVGGASWTAVDVAYFVLVAMMICARWIDQRSGHATTAEGIPATWHDFWLYAIGVPLMAIVIWILENLLEIAF